VGLDELVFHPWSVQGPRNVPTFVGGSGSYVIDADGRRYLDFCSQLVFTNLGHQHPRIVAAVKEQADRLCIVAPGYASDIRGEAARMRSPRRASGTCCSPQVVRRRSSMRFGWPVCTTGGPRCSPPTARTTVRRRPRSTSPVTRAAGLQTRAAGAVHFSAHSSTARRSGRAHPRKSMSERSRSSPR
jgi:hypothetical protein